MNTIGRVALGRIAWIGLSVLTMILGTAAQAPVPVAHGAHLNPVGLAPVTMGTPALTGSTRGVAVNPVTNRIYVGNTTANNVTVIDGATNTVVAVVAVGSKPDGIAVNPETNRVYVANTNSHTVSVIDGTANAVVATIALEANSYPTGVAVNPTTNRVYVATGGRNTVKVIDGATNNVLTEVWVPGAMDVAVNVTLNRVYAVRPRYVGAYPSNIFVIDGANNNITATIGGFGDVPSGNIAYNSASNRIYVTIVNPYDGLLGGVSVIDAASHAPSGGISGITKAPAGLAANATTNRIYVPIPSTGTGMPHKVQIADGATNAVIREIAVNGQPRSVGVNPSTDRVYVPVPGLVAVIGESTEPPEASLVSWWKADGTANDQIPGSNNHGTLQNGATFEAGKVGQAFSLDGINDVVFVGNKASLDVHPTDFTITAWVFLRGISGFIAGKESCGDANSYALMMSGTQPVFRVISQVGTNFMVSASTSITLNAWHHLAAEKDGTTLRIFVNGNVSGTQTVSGDFNRNALPFTIGDRPQNTASGCRLLVNGLVDDVRVYNRALTASQIQAMVNRPPVANAGPDQTAQSVSPAGAVVTLDGSASSDPDNDPLEFTWTGPFGTLTGASISPTLPLGSHTITLTVNDGKGGTASDTVGVTVVMVNRPPVANAGPDQTPECVSPAGAVVTLDGSASSDPDNDPLEFTWTGPFGTLTGASISPTLPLGSHTITLTVNDGKGETASDTVGVTVSDSTPPTLSVSLSASTLTPANHTMRTITATLATTDACTASPTVRLLSIDSSEAPGGVGPGDESPDVMGAALGTDDREFQLRAEGYAASEFRRTYRVTYEAADGANNKTTKWADVTVPNTPPLANAGASQTLECSGPTGASVTLSGAASSDADGDPLTFTWTGALTGTGSTISGTLPLGTHTVTLTVNDGKYSGTANASVVVVVRDTAPPAVNVALSPSTLWPPNHKLVEITAAVQASDVCDAGPKVALISITSNEPDSSVPGDQPYDIQGAEFGTNDRLFSLRSERLGTGTGRLYTVTYRATDASGKFADRTAYVLVPHGRPVSMDIVPGSFPNSCDCRLGSYLLPVAIVSTAQFDATTLNADSVVFGKTGGETAEAHRDAAGKAVRHVEDVNGDGRPDMVFHFRLDATGFGCADIPPGQTSVTFPAWLYATGRDGDPISAEDSLRLVLGAP